MASGPGLGLLAPVTPAPSRAGSLGAQFRRAPRLYVVDDVPEIAELYLRLLQPAGYQVRAFTDRTEALQALQVDETKPDLLITDYDGSALPVEVFMGECRRAHPVLLILMVSGFSPEELRFRQEKPDRFLRKPFRLGELERAIHWALSRG